MTDLSAVGEHLAGWQGWPGSALCLRVDAPVRGCRDMSRRPGWPGIAACLALQALRPPPGTWFHRPALAHGRGAVRAARPVPVRLARSGAVRQDHAAFWMTCRREVSARSRSTAMAAAASAAPTDVILSFRVGQGCDLRRPVVDSVADETPAA